MTGNDVTWPEVTGSDPEVTSFDQKSPGSGCSRPEIKFWVRLRSYMAVTPRRWHHVTVKDVTWPEVTESDPEGTSFDRKSPRSGCRRPVSQVLGTFYFLQGCNSQELAVT